MDKDLPGAGGPGSPLTYRDAGVDTKEGERAVSLMKEHVKKRASRS